MCGKHAIFSNNKLAEQQKNSSPIVDERQQGPSHEDEGVETKNHLKQGFDYGGASNRAYVAFHQHHHEFVPERHVVAAMKTVPHRQEEQHAPLRLNAALTKQNAGAFGEEPTGDVLVENKAAPDAQPNHPLDEPHAGKIVGYDVVIIHKQGQKLEKRQAGSQHGNPARRDASQYIQLQQVGEQHQEQDCQVPVHIFMLFIYIEVSKRP
ncbi:hypothetical protein D910_05216 [Dendroctonus ponderosae]|uniref:Uncharacterized protein n=1 Tax=Dendroctonus ponderosae TaxID=77166 RepID=U4U467_DENPD|nr:hypothetical protein D910_05216 [Dendroctonus ponderosae]